MERRRGNKSKERSRVQGEKEGKVRGGRGISAMPQKDEDIQPVRTIHELQTGMCLLV